MIHMLIALLAVGATVIGVDSAWSQQVLMDKGVRLGGLWCFPLASNSREYVYLPHGARLGSDQTGQPQFSFIRYVINEPQTAPPAASANDNAPAPAASGQTITQADGGGILHFLVLLDTPQSMIDEAQKELRKRLKDDTVVVRGPIVFQDGRYALVSSILSPASAAPERKLLASGRAPVLEGNRLALSFDLKPQEASLLMQSFQMNTPDVSLVFDMTFVGLSEAYEADLLIDWSEVKKSKALGAGGSIYFVKADVDLAFDELRRTNAIKLRSSGENSAMEGLLNTVYSKLLDLLFRPVEPERIPQDQRGGIMQALNTLISPQGGAASSGNTTGFGAYVGFQLKEMKSSGTSTLNFNHRSSVERHSYVTFNIGNFYQRFGKDENYFKAVNLADPMFQQREIHVGIDGALLPDFDRYINTVTVTLRKEHQNGQQTLREVILDRQTVAQRPGAFRMIYGWSGDQDRQAWLQYDYRTRWSFKGGGTFQTDWMRTDSPMVEVFAPYERRTVQLVGNNADLLKKGVRAVIVQVEYPFFGEQRRHQIVVRPEKAAEESQVQITLPAGQFEYDYTITWQMDQNRRVTARRRESSGLVFIDEMPEQPVAQPSSVPMFRYAPIVTTQSF
jgi:hypothetical protein